MGTRRRDKDTPPSERDLARVQLLLALLGTSSERGGPRLRRPTLMGHWDPTCTPGGCYVIEIHCRTPEAIARVLRRLNG